MKRKRSWHFRLFAVLMAGLLVLPVNLIGATAPVQSASKVVHKEPSGNYIPGFRINLDAEISDPAGLLTARCYFKTKNDTNFAFVEMFSTGGDSYQATLPAPFVNSEEIQYVFVAVNNNKQVARTQIFTLTEGETEEGKAWKDINEVKEVRVDQAQDAAEYVSLFNNNKSSYSNRIARYQTTSSEGTLQVSTELGRELAQVQGFYDTATVTQVPATAKYGFLAADLYSAQAMAAGGGAAATGGTTAGVVVATTGGLSTAAMVGIGVGVVAVGGVAAASGGGGSSSSGGSTPATPVDPGTPVTPPVNPGGDTLTAAALEGYWNFTGVRRDGVSRSGNITFRTNGTHSFRIVDADNQVNDSGAGTWSLIGSTLTVNFSGLITTWVGTASGNGTRFTLDTSTGSNHGSFTFTR